MTRRLAPLHQRAAAWAPPAADAASGRKRAELFRAAAGFVHTKASWSHFVTLTYRQEVPLHRCQQDLRAFLRALAVLAGEHVRYASGIGHQQRDVLHVHLLLELPPQMRQVSVYVDRLWRKATGAHVKTEAFDRTRPAGAYLVDHDTWDLQVACPRPRVCRREFGCVEAPGPW